MKHSIASVTLPGDIVAKVRAAAAAGFEGIELFENDLTVSDVSAGQLRRIAEECGIEIVALQPLRDFEGMPPDLAALNLRRARSKLELATRLGTKRLLVCSNVSDHAIDDPSLAAAQLRELAEMAAPYGIEIGYEALAWGRHVNEWPEAWEIVSAAAHPNLGIVLDSFHVLVKTTELQPLAGIDPSKITLVQLADAPRLEMGVLNLSRHYRCFPGQGGLPVEEFARIVHSTGYSGYWSHEIFSDEFRGSRLAPTAEDGKRSLAWLDERIELTRSASKRTANPLRKESSKSIDQSVDDFAFVEFAVEDSHRNELAELLSALGFIETHRHRSKDVGLMQLGKVNFVLNSELDSPAYNYYREHGISVCAIGLRTRHIDALSKRAERLGYDWHEGSAPPGQLQIPAVRGLQGSLIYFVDGDAAFEEIDFIRTLAPATDNGIRRIDHVAATVRDIDFLPNTLFYRAMLGMNVGATVDLIDPNGLVYSRVARNESGTVRIPFNASHDWGTTLRRFIDQARGGGIQQIAIESGDIFQTVRSIPPQYLLPVPSNYYDDLASRTLLDAERVEQLRRYGILYDSNASGEFFHCYTRNVAGMFFEIVQRVGSYDRYGEVNSAVRLAAQTRLARSRPDESM